MMKLPISNYQLPISKLNKFFVVALFYIVLVIIFFSYIITVYAYEGENCEFDLGCSNYPDEHCDEEGHCQRREAADDEGNCDSDIDCGVGEDCQMGQCTSSDIDRGDAIEGESCAENNDCMSGLGCEDGICVNRGGNNGSGGGVSFNNPLNGINTIPDLIARALSYIIGLIGMLAVAAFVYGGILYMTSGGSEEQSEKGKKVLGYAVMGLIVSILSYVIVNTVIRIISG